MPLPSPRAILRTYKIQLHKLNAKYNRASKEQQFFLRFNNKNIEWYIALESKYV